MSAKVNAVFEAAVPAGEDPARYADLLLRVRDAVLGGEKPPALPRSVIDRSWARALSAGVDPDFGADMPDPLEPDEIKARLRGRLGRAIPALAQILVPAAEDAGHVMVVVDRDGRILWREGAAHVANRADSLGFQTGADWREETVGTNAIGTALAVEHAVQVYSAEHLVAAQHDWTCAAAPIHDPSTGELLGVVDVSGAAPTVHPSTLALVDSAARVAMLYLETEHQQRLGRLRSLAAPLLARAGGQALVTDHDGWVSAAVGLAAAERIALPSADLLSVVGTYVHVPAIGCCCFEPVPGGWLIRVASSDEDIATTRLCLDFSGARACARVQSELGSWEHWLRLRHAEVLCALAAHPQGRRASDLSVDLFGEPGHEVAVRAELVRLRQLLGAVIVPRPYRIAEWVHLDIRWPGVGADLLPASTAPLVCAQRIALTMS